MDNLELASKYDFITLDLYKTYVTLELRCKAVCSIWLL